MSISDIKGSFSLHNGIQIPYLGLGVFESKSGAEVINAVQWALEAGYRHIDTASIYRNEEGVGEGIRRSRLPRENIFLVSKVWNRDQGYESTLHAFEESLNKLDTDYLDLYLIHWPVKDQYVETWRALEYLYESGRVKSIGVSNFMQHHLEHLMSDAEIIPMVNQMEFHPYLTQQLLVDFCSANSIQYEAWAPIMRGKIFEIDLFNELAKKYGKSEVQIVLRWNLQKGVVTIPKSARQDRIISNAEIFDFELSQEDVSRIDALDRGERIGPDPDDFNF